MKIKILILFLLAFSYLFAETPVGFEYNQSSQQCFYFVRVAELDGVSLDNSDWVGVFNNDVCVGSSQWDGEYTTLAAMGSDGFTYSESYCTAGDLPTFKVWDSETQQIWEFTNNSPIATWSPNSTYTIESIEAFSASPKIDVSVTELIFPNTVVNSTSTLPLYIRNIGEENLTGTIQTSGAFAVIDLSTEENSFEVSPNDSLLVEIAFTPYNSNSFSSNIEINSNSSINESISILSSGTGIQAQISIDRELIEFYNVWINHQVSKQFIVSNNGTSTLNVTDINSDEASYSFSPESFSVEPNNQQTVEVTFSPEEITNFDTSITITSNIADETLDITGNGYLLNADFITLADSTEVGNSTQFFDNSNGDILGYEWSFNDVFSSEDENPIHTFGLIGTHSVELTIIDRYFSTSTIKNYIVYGVPEGSISTDELNFDNSYLGTNSEPLTLTIYSTRTANLVINELTFQQESGAFNVSPIELPIIVAPNDSISIEVIFTPNSAGNNFDVLQIHTNDVMQSCTLIGTGLVAPPKAVETITITVNGANISLNWEEITESILDTPVTVNYYKIEASASPDGPFGWIGTSNTTSYTHYEVAQFSEKYFYRVIAVTQ